MSVRAIHLNLLYEAERLSSSPVRAKVVLPLIAAVFLAAMLLWWVFLFVQGFFVEREIKSLRAEMASTERDYAVVRRLKGVLSGKSAELDQCRGYMNARRPWGETLAAVAAAVPSGVQLGMIEIPEPPPQNLLPPPGIKLPPLLGPTGAVETVTFRLSGKSVREAYVFDLLDAVRESEAFTNAVVISSGGAGKTSVSPRMRQFGQDREVGDGGSRAIVFDVEYATPGRRFLP